MFSLGYYQHLFDVSTKDVLRRLLKAVFPLGEPMFDRDGVTKPDLYGALSSPRSVCCSNICLCSFTFTRSLCLSFVSAGPFWICTTLIFLIGATGNMAEYLSHPTNSELRASWRYDFEKLTLAATMFYFSIVIFPIGVYFFLRKFVRG